MFRNATAELGTGNLKKKKRQFKRTVIKFICEKQVFNILLLAGYYINVFLYCIFYIWICICI